MEFQQFDLEQEVKTLFKFIPFEDPEGMSLAVLAYVGDAVYDMSCI